MRNESDTSGGSAFYDFLPYRFGPFSFALYQELDKLASMNFVQAPSDTRIMLGEAADNVNGIDRRVEHDIARMVRRFSVFPKNRLIDYVYNGYPSYTYNSELRRLTRRPRSKPKVYTAGYEGRSIDAFLNLLLQAGITRLIDVRKNPIARRYGFHKSTLDRLCGKLDINYIHVPTLGIHSEKRRNLDGPDAYQRLFADYEATTLRDESDSINTVVDLVTERSSVLVCMEADHVSCHRSRLAKVVSRRSGLPIHNLGCLDE